MELTFWWAEVETKQLRPVSEDRTYKRDVRVRRWQGRGAVSSPLQTRWLGLVLL